MENNELVVPILDALSNLTLKEDLLSEVIYCKWYPHIKQIGSFLCFSVPFITLGFCVLIQCFFKHRTTRLNRMECIVYFLKCRLELR